MLMSACNSGSCVCVCFELRQSSRKVRNLGGVWERLWRAEVTQARQTNGYLGKSGVYSLRALRSHLKEEAEVNTR